MSNIYCYYNAHPKDLNVDDCVKRAISVVTGINYKQVSLELNRYKKITKCSKFNSPGNPEQYILKVLKGVQQSYPAVKGQDRMNGERFALSHPKGRYLLRMAGHLTACIDGVIYDTWDCTQKCVYKSWRIEGIYEKETCIKI